MSQSRANNSSKRELIQRHTDLYRQYYDDWTGDAAGSPESPTSGEIAFGLIEHAGMVHRYTGAPEAALPLQELGPEALRDLVSAAYRHVNTKSLCTTLRKIAQDDDFDESDTYVVESAVLARDSLGVVLEWTARLTGNLSDTLTVQDIPVLRARADAEAEVYTLDETFSGMFDITLVGMTILASKREAICVPILDEQWWLADAEELLLQRENALTAEVLAPSAAQKAVARSSDYSPIARFVTKIKQLLVGRQPDYVTLAWADDAVAEFRLGGKHAGVLQAQPAEHAIRLRVLDENRQRPGWAGPGDLLVFYGHDGRQLGQWALGDSMSVSLQEGLLDELMLELKSPLSPSRTGENGRLVICKCADMSTLCELQPDFS